MTKKELKNKMDLLKKLQILESNRALYNTDTNNAFIACEPIIKYGKGNK